MPEEIKLELSAEQYTMLSEAISRSKSNTHRIDELTTKTELFMDMNKNIAVIAEQMKHTQEAIVSLKNDMETIKNNRKIGIIEEQMKHAQEAILALKSDMEEIKSKPNKFLDNLKGVAAGAVITAIIGAVLALIL